MTSFFGVGGNPFSTPVGQKIGKSNNIKLSKIKWKLHDFYTAYQT